MNRLVLTDLMKRILHPALTVLDHGSRALQCTGVFFVLLSASVLLAGPASNLGSGSADKPYIVPEVLSPPRIDGVLDEKAWKGALALSLDYEVQPGENVAPPAATDVLLMSDSVSLLVAFRCNDPDPKQIRAHLSDRDQIGDDDWVGIVLDTFNDERRSFDLLVNPLGVQEDFIEFKSGSASWDGIWESAGQITEWGYSVEMRVPFNQLRFQRIDGPQVWGFDAVRRYPRSQQHHIGLFPRDRSNNCYLCQTLKIRGFDGASPGRNIELCPTFTAVRSYVREGLPDGDFKRESKDEEFGVTATWGMTPNMTFTGTINPDFSQVEADALQLDINQPFALYYSEQRPFFTEGADFFRTLKTAIYTRTMRDPEWGLKLSGKEGKHTVGGYVVRDEITNLIFPGSQSSASTSLDIASSASVLRYKRDLGSRYTIGGLLTDRRGNDYSNLVVGCDGNLLLTNTDQIQVQLMGSTTRYPDDTAGEFDQPRDRFKDHYFAIEYDHESRTAGWWLDYDDVGEGFRADIGFIPMVGYRNVEGGLNYSWNAGENSWWSDLSAGNEIHYYEDAEGRPFDRSAALWFYYGGIHQSSFYAQAYRSREVFGGNEFDLTSFYFSGGISPSASSYCSFGVNLGDRIDYANSRLGDRIRISPYLRYNWGNHLRLSIDHAFERLNIDEGELYTANITELSAIYHFNVRSFFRAILQYVDYRYEPELYTFEIDPEYQNLFAQLLFSYKLNPRTVLYLGYTSDSLGSQEYKLTQDDWTVFAKLGYAWIL